MIILFLSLCFFQKYFLVGKRSCGFGSFMCVDIVIMRNRLFSVFFNVKFEISCGQMDNRTMFDAIKCKLCVCIVYYIGSPCGNKMSFIVFRFGSMQFFVLLPLKQLRWNRGWSFFFCFCFWLIVLLNIR